MLIGDWKNNIRRIYNALDKPGKIPISAFFLSDAFIFSDLCSYNSTFVEPSLQINHFICKTNPIYKGP